VRANVFKECFPEYQPTGCFLQNHALYSFNYHFNTRGYLTYFLPVLASYGRRHHDSNNVTLAKENNIMGRQYKSAIIRYANEVLSGKREHVFRDGRSNVINKIEPGGLELCRRKVLDYRTNRKYYLDKRRTNALRYWRRKLKILAGYYLCGKRIYN
jgi:predicted nucleotidyltransferase